MLNIIYCFICNKFRVWSNLSDLQVFGVIEWIAIHSQFTKFYWLFSFRTSLHRHFTANFYAYLPIKNNRIIPSAHKSYSSSLLIPTTFCFQQTGEMIAISRLTVSHAALQGKRWSTRSPAFTKMCSQEFNVNSTNWYSGAITVLRLEYSGDTLFLY